jgi:hypothetical protein
MKISYGITVKDEIVEIQHLLTFLLKNKRQQDEIIILFDAMNGSSSVEEYLRANSINDDCGFKWYPYPFNGHFADFKNYLNSWCTGDYIINIDADEIPTEDFMTNIVEVIEKNQEIDVFVVPRWNKVEGLTESHIAKWGWNVDTLGRVNWPDYQMRVYRNANHITWINPVHEVLNGFSTFAPLPDEMYFHHDKTIDRQEKQNQYYSTI